MLNHRIKQISSPGYLPSRLAYLCVICFLLLLLKYERVEARLIWIPRTNDNREGSPQYYNSINSDNNQMVNIHSNRQTENTEKRRHVLQGTDNITNYPTTDDICLLRFPGMRRHKPIINKEVRRPRQSNNRLNQLIKKAIRTYSKECQDLRLLPSSGSRHLERTRMNLDLKRHKKLNDRCRNIRVVFYYAQQLLC